MTTTAHTPGGNGICGACHRPVSTGPCPEVSPAPDELIITRDGEEPELMAKMVDHIAVGLDDALDYLSRPDAPAPSDEDPEALARATAG